MRLDPKFSFLFYRLGVNTRIVVPIIGGVILLLGLAFGVARWEASTSGAAADEADHPPKPVEQRIDINVAPLRTLDKLLGIGPELAERIVQHRPYKKLDELITRKVLGRKQFARIKDRIRVGPSVNGSLSQ